MIEVGCNENEILTIYLELCECARGNGYGTLTYFSLRPLVRAFLLTLELFAFLLRKCKLFSNHWL